MEDEDPYESLPPETPVIHHMMAGSIAGVAEHCLMYPVDVVKTRMMCIRGNPETQYKSITGALRTMIRQEGWSRPVRGVSAVFVGAGPAHAMYFAGYEKIKRELTLKFTKGKVGESSMANALAGGSATLLHDAVMNPAEVVKQRMQMFQSPYKNCRDCIIKTYRAEGVGAFYRSYMTALTMNVPFQVTHFVIYEKMQDFTNRDRDYNPATHVLSGAVAGGVAAAVTTPMDVCRTLLNTQQGLCAVPHCSESPLPGGPGITLNNTRTATVSGMFQAGRIVYATNGLGGFFKGCRPRVIYQMPATAISWACYEFFKHFLVANRLDDESGGSGGGGGELDITAGTPRLRTVKDNLNKAMIMNAADDGESSSPVFPSSVPPSSIPPLSSPSTPAPHSNINSETTTRITAKAGLPLSGPSCGVQRICAATCDEDVHNVVVGNMSLQEVLPSNTSSSVSTKCLTS